ncbi:MAG: cytochrome c [Desulfobacterales bacterium]|jgi:mono/diheme cytochrome c family protein
MLIFLSLACLGFFNLPHAWGQTFISGKVITADGKVVASGVVALEKGELHNDAFLAGGAIGSDGAFKIPLPTGGPWGLHVYSQGYIYFPLQLQIKAGMDNEIPVILPVDGNPADDPRISDIRFNKISGQVFQIKMKVEDANNNLGPQMLAVDTKRFRSYRLVPQSGDLKDKKADFPSGEYVSPFIPLPLDGEDLNNWLFVVADHQCSNGPVYTGLNQTVFKPPMAHAEKLKCEVAGIWKSNFDKVYQFDPEKAGKFSGIQFAGDILIDKMTQSEKNVALDFRFKGDKGKADLQLACQQNQIRLLGTFQLPERSGEWIFTKLQNAKATEDGKDIFSANCSGCHFVDRKDTKVGPGLQGLFNNPKLPSSGRPTNAENVRETIVNGQGKMPPFKHLEESKVNALIDYLKSL